jgi:catechol 2,3-dioxygenase-like lactoylglutathione lyase family enzyme
VITGAHAILYSENADADRAFFGDVLGLDSVDAGGGWLIFALPPAELAVHPSQAPPQHELYLMCDDLAATVADLNAKGVELAEGISEERWGVRAALRLPSGARLGLYEPRHPSPPHR